MRTPPTARVAAIILGLQALGLVILVVWQVIALGEGESASLPSGIALIVLTLIGVVAVAAFAVAVVRGASWGRSGGIVVQLLILAVALGAATGGYAHPLIGLALAAVGVAGLVPLVLDVRRQAAERRAADDEARR
ncbi:histidine kinase [Microbacterium protaetiae]|uniref:Histidine kinase n=1 Tax=Microbacterium protaetiae TaxID=2509458 RepID=A0A4P6EEQ2_9MICO|nr:histidine kinase [Microbacterium protaetiae]QAY60674.1 histidine kinase [Microbacterium protaetiae]